MHFKLTGHHVEITDALRTYVNSKLERLERHFDNMTDVHCILTVEKLQQKAEATVHVSGATIYADAIDADMYAAIDALIDKLDRQVRRFKDKLTDHHPKHANRSKFS